VLRLTPLITHRLRTGGGESTGANYQYLGKFQYVGKEKKKNTPTGHRSKDKVNLFHNNSNNID
jgi:hypothetical protein